MEKQQAWEILAQSVPQLRATLQEHQLLQQALITLKPNNEIKEEKIKGSVKNG